MAEVIVLTAAEAEKVRGLSPRKGGHSIEPVPLKDGRFILGAEVLDDPAHDDVRDFLASLPRSDIEKLPIYTDADEQPEAVEVARLTERKADVWTREEIDAFRDDVSVPSKTP